MKTISVAAPCNGSGKTSLILSLLKTFPGAFSVIKFTTIYREEQFCPVKDHDCACHRLEGQYIICADREVLSEPNTDTGRIWRAGTNQTLWCVARPEGYSEMLKDLFASYLKSNSTLLMEGNTILQYLPPRLRLFIVNPYLPFSWWKTDTEALMEKADFVVVNPHTSGTASSTHGADPSVETALDGVKAKRIPMENRSRLDQWQDQRIYQVVADLLVG